MIFEKIDDLLNRHGGEGCFLILLPEYRPDLARGIANHLGFGFFDYRQEIMSEFAWEATRLTLDQLSETLADKTRQSAQVAFNIEALLAAKPEDQRREWFSQSLQASWDQPLLLPLAIYVDETPTGESRVLDLRDEELEDQTLISRLIT